MSVLLDAINSASEQELAEVVKRIEDLTNELDALRVVQKLLDVRIHGKQKRVLGKGKTGSELACKIHDLLTAEGSLPAIVIAQRLQLKERAVTMSCRRSEWFKQTPDGEWFCA